MPDKYITLENLGDFADELLSGITTYGAVNESLVTISSADWQTFLGNHYVKVASAAAIDKTFQNRKITIGSADVHVILAKCDANNFTGSFLYEDSINIYEIACFLKKDSNNDWFLHLRSAQLA